MTSNNANTMDGAIRILDVTEIEAVSGARTIMIDCSGPPPTRLPGDIFINPWLGGGHGTQSGPRTGGGGGRGEGGGFGR